MGIFFALLSPAIFGITNYIDKFLLEKHNIHIIVISVFGGLFAFLTGIIVLFLTGFYPVDTKSLVIILVSGFFTAVYLPPYYKALSLDETSRVMPLFQLYPIFVFVLSYLFLHETLSLFQSVGSIFILVGGFIISIEKLEGKIFRFRPALWYAIISSFLFALAQFFYKFGVVEIPFWSSLPYEGFGIALGSIAILLYKNNFRIFKKESKKISSKVYLYMSFNEFIYVFARYTGYFAISLIPVGIVSVLGGLQPVFVLSYGIILSLWFPYILKEVISKKSLAQKILAILLMCIGFYFISV